MTRPQDIVVLIDVGLQTPAPDPTYGEVSPTNRETCARCPRPPADESEFCLGCREYLLGDREEDPREEPAQGSWLVSGSAREMARSVLMTREEAARGSLRCWPVTRERECSDNICGNTRCVNPDHLEPTAADWARLREMEADSLGGQVARIGRDMEVLYQQALADLAQHPERMTDEMRQAISDYEAIMRTRRALDDQGRT